MGNRLKNEFENFHGPRTIIIALAVVAASFAAAAVLPHVDPENPTIVSCIPAVFLIVYIFTTSGNHRALFQDTQVSDLLTLHCNYFISVVSLYDGGNNTPYLSKVLPAYFFKQRCIANKCNIKVYHMINSLSEKNYTIYEKQGMLYLQQRTKLIPLPICKFPKM